jgi:hypothetical protein
VATWSVEGRRGSAGRWPLAAGGAIYWAPARVTVTGLHPTCILRFDRVVGSGGHGHRRPMSGHIRKYPAEMRY